MKTLRDCLASPLLLPIVALLVAAPASAEWSPGGTAMYTGLGLPDGAGNFISVIPVAPGSRTSSANKYTANGVTLWTTGNIVTAIESAAPDQVGGAYYAGTTQFGNSLANDILAVHVTTGGAIAWGPITVCDAANVQNLPLGASDQAGNFYIVWKDQRAGVNNFQLFVQKLNSAGVAQWAGNGVLVSSVGIQGTNIATHTVIPDESGGCVVAWQDTRAGVDIYAQRIDSNGAAQWTANGVAVCTAPGAQQTLSGMTDGAGGTILVWMDQRSGDFDIYGQRIDGTGTSQWTPNGVGITVVAGSDQGELRTVSDGVGGAFLAYSDCRNCGTTSNVDIFAQHVDGSGVSLWIPNGVLVAGSSAAETAPNLARNGSGGILLGWMRAATTPTGTAYVSPWAQRLDSNGTAMWASNGVEQLVNEFSTGSGPPLVVTDGAGGAFIGWSALVGRALGASGEPAWISNYRAIITSVADVPGDEGGRVTVNISRPLSDGSLTVSPQTTGYSCWRLVSGSAASGPARLIDRVNVLGSSGRSASPAKFSDFPPGTWESVGYLPAMHLPTYAFGAPTHSDATPPVDESFVVVNHTSTAFYVVSAVGTGHSEDNLPPGPPQSPAGGYAGGTTVILHWANNTESDLWHYSVYRGTSADFVPSQANRIGQPTAASFQDDSFQPGTSYYKISAVDRHQNESLFSLVSPSQITTVPSGTIPRHAYLAAPAPNPFRSGTTFEYGLAHDARVQISIYDAKGRRVTCLVDEVETAGVRRKTWNGTDDSRNHVPAGIYLLRFDGDGLRELRKIVAMN